MAFTGTPTITRLGRLLTRITGVSVAHGVSGPIGFAGSGADIELPDDFPQLPPHGLTLSDVVLVLPQFGHHPGGNEATHLHVIKTESPFTVEVMNDSGHASSPLEIYVQYLHSIIR